MRYSLITLGFLATILSGLAGAEPPIKTPLARAFAEAWQRQPAALSLSEREKAVAAQQEAANTWTAGPASILMSERSDRFNRNRGTAEQEIGLALPLWLPGEQVASQTLASTESSVLRQQTQLLRLQLAQTMREAWWAWLLAHQDLALSEERWAAAGRLHTDVERRFRAGDVSRADLNAAAGVLALAEAQVAEMGALAAQASARVHSLTGRTPGNTPHNETPEPLPDPKATAEPGEHPQWQALEARVQRADAEVELARQQTRANPELTLSSRQDRDSRDATFEQNWAISLRIPLDNGPRQAARIANTRAQALELQQELSRLRHHLNHERELAHSQFSAAQRQLAASERRAAWARENRTAYDRSFRLGESDLPTRLRIEAEAFEAERALGRARIALAQRISQWRQSLGLLPE